MIDPKDPGTIDAFPTPAKRGRPATGKALSATARKKIQRMRDERWTDDPSKATKSALLAAISRGHPEADTEKWIYAKAMSELAKRIGLDAKFSDPEDAAFSY